tara:strand:+ start:49 stop:564 length:516 start_codon:yes stop_codon:yes gene_type:complete
MRLLILFIFVAVPIAEIAIFIEAGHFFGIWTTLALILITAIIGSGMLRHQGLRALRNTQNALNRNELPVREVLTGLCLLVAGVLLLTPGFLTDCIGFFLLIPRFRLFLGNTIFAQIRNQSYSRVWPSNERTRNSSDNDRQYAPVIDGEFHEIDNNTLQNHDHEGSKNNKNL